MGGYESWHDFYTSDLQSPLLLWILPALFLTYRWRSRNVVPRGPEISPQVARFVDRWAIFFAIVTLIDPLVTGPFLRWAVPSSSPLQTTIPLTFVLLGDFRVFLLVFVCIGRGTGRMPPGLRATFWTWIVPVCAYSAFALLSRLSPGVRDQWLWLFYEIGFFLVARILLDKTIFDDLPVSAVALRSALRRSLSLVLTYYGLWALADILILTINFDLAWGIRILPNQLYYGLFVPYVWSRFVGRRA